MAGFQDFLRQIQGGQDPDRQQVPSELLGLLGQSNNFIDFMRRYMSSNQDYAPAGFTPPALPDNWGDMDRRQRMDAGIRPHADGYYNSWSARNGGKLHPHQLGLIPGASNFDLPTRSDRAAAAERYGVGQGFSATPAVPSPGLGQPATPAIPGNPAARNNARAGAQGFLNVIQNRGNVRGTTPATPAPGFGQPATTAQPAQPAAPRSFDAGRQAARRSFGGR